ncbi:MAG TPA: glycosyltransferase [Rubricoccaceae bacterium]|jgi:hypothetical protein
MSRTSARLRSAAPPAAPATVSVQTVDVSVVIVTYNVREFLEQAIESVERASGGLTIETFVVDNDSADGTVTRVRERFPHVRLIANEANVGFATANNQAIREARGRYVLVLNPDTLVQEDTLRTLVAFMDARPTAGAVGPRILNPDGTFAPESRRSFPTPAVAFYRISGLGRLFPKSARFGRYNLSHVSPDQGGEVDALSGSCMMVRRAAVLGDDQTSDGGDNAQPDSLSRRPAGLLDEDFFMYGEDLDWCYRIQQAGWRIHYTPRTQIIHYKGESTKKGDLRYVLLFYGAMLRFVEKHVRQSEAGRGERIASQLLAAGLRAGIVVRGAVAALGRLGRSVAGPLVDVALAWVALAAAAALWARADGFAFGASYYGLVLPVYAALQALAVRVASGRLRAVAVGTAGAVLTVAAASFFVPSIAFSRAAVLFGYAAAAVLLMAWRLVRRRKTVGPRRVLVVGSAAEAVRLRRLVDVPGRSPVTVVGYVAARPDPIEADTPPHAGLPRQIRDLARLHAVQEVVFAADSLSNTAILDGMRALRDVPVHLKILASGRDRIIGKASVEDVSAPLLDAERAVAPLRRGRRTVEVPVALLLLALGPVLRLAARVAPGVRTRRAVALAAQMPAVLAGRIALVGVDTARAQPPAAWGLAPGVVSVLDTLAAPAASITEAHRAYWFYARHQSAGLDLQILWRALTR